MDAIIEVLAVPLGWLMRICYLLIGNYGLTIIFFTLLTKIILFPVSLLVQKNSIKMVRMQPELNALRIQYADDKDAYLDAQVALYKKKKYRPMAGVLPLLIQIPIIFELIDVIYRPLKHILRLSVGVIAAFTAEATALFGAPIPSAPELKIVAYVMDGGAARFASLPVAGAAEAVAAIERMDLHFLGVDLAATPSISHLDLLFLVPVLAGLSAWALCYFQNRVNVLQIEQNRLSQVGMTLFMIAFSTFFAFIVPAGVGLYWIAGNLLAIPFLYLLNWVMDPKKYIDYEYLETVKRLKKESDEKRAKYKAREKADYRAFCRDETQENMQLMFYSEQSGFYKYFQNIIEALLKHSDITIHYVTSDPEDAVFSMDEPRIRPYYVGEERLIPLMMKVEADIVVMTVPDLEKYHIKRSRVRKDVEYIYTDHGCTSLNLTDRAGALDAFDTVFAVGPSQVREVRQMEKLRHTKEKTVVECGYGLIDNMIAAYAKMEKKENDVPTILIAPSWAEDNLMDSCLDALLNGLLGKGFRVIVRPHPQYVRRFPAEMDTIHKRYEGRFGDDFAIETDFSSNVTVYTADLVITDWSAIGFEFCLTTERPALFVNTKMKAVNPQWRLIEEKPIELAARSVLGRAVEKEELVNVEQIVRELLSEREAYAARIREAKPAFLYNIGTSGEVGAQYIIDHVKPRRRHTNAKA